jgi:hypothetical protein
MAFGWFDIFATFVIIERADVFCIIPIIGWVGVFGG